MNSDFMASDVLPRNCPVCGRDEAEAHLQKGELRLVRCRQCSMIYANPVPANYSSGKYYQETGAEYYLSANKLESDYSEVRFERELRLFRRYCSGGSVLDVGCSSGAFLFQLSKRFPGAYQVCGTDVSGPSLDYAESRGLPVVRGNFPEHDFGGQKFDAVTFWAVLEHLTEPKRFLDKAASVLRPEGFCFVLVPNMRSLAVRMLGANYRYIYPQHLNYFTKDTLAKLADTALPMVEVRTTHWNPLVIWQDWRSSGAEVSNRERGELLKRTTGYKQKRWLRPVKAVYDVAERALGALGLADNLVAVLRKTQREVAADLRRL